MNRSFVTYEDLFQTHRRARDRGFLQRFGVRRHKNPLYQRPHVRNFDGPVSNGGRVCYFARARAGQQFNATISSRSGKVLIFESGETSYSYEVEQSGDQSACVDNLAGATAYSLTVSTRKRCPSVFFASSAAFA